MPKGYSYKPCPICKTEKGFFTVDGACRDCLDLIADGKRFRAQLESEASPLEDYLVDMYGDHYSLDKISHKAQEELDALSKVVNRLITVLHGERLHSPEGIRPKTKPLSPQLDRGGRSFGQPAIARLRPEVADAIREINRLIILVGPHIYNDGLRHGQDLLKNLASGALSVGDFNEATIKGKF